MIPGAAPWWQFPPTTATIADADVAIRSAAKIAIDAGDYRRARTLLDLLDEKSNPIPVTNLAATRAQKE